MMKKLIVITLALAILCLSCKKEKDSFNDYVSSVKVVPTENALRFKVETVKTKECSPKVQVRIKGTDKWQTMPGEMAVLLYPETEYECRVVIGELAGEPVVFSTGALPEEVPVYDLILDKGGPADGYVLQWKESDPGYITFCDPLGKVVWYDTFEGGVRCADYNPKTGLICALTGSVLIDGCLRPRPATNITVLDLFGKRHSSIETAEVKTKYPHHELRWISDDNMILVDHTCHTIDLSSIDLSAEEKVWGDNVTVIDMQGNVIWDWDVLEHMNVIEAKDYLPMNQLYDVIHMNSADIDSEGNYYASLHSIQEIWKIDGITGEVLYKLGPHGDITVEGGIPSGGYHSIVVLSPDRFLVNNNSANMSSPTHGICYEVDAKAKTARITTKVPLAVEYTSTTGGYFQILSDEMVMFDSGQGKCCAFTDMSGELLRVFTRKDISYRAFYFDKLF